jgi:hypothetical protein
VTGNIGNVGEDAGLHFRWSDHQIDRSVMVAESSGHCTNYASLFVAFTTSLYYCYYAQPPGVGLAGAMPIWSGFDTRFFGPVSSAKTQRCEDVKDVKTRKFGALAHCGGELNC